MAMKKRAKRPKRARRITRNFLTAEQFRKIAAEFAQETNVRVRPMTRAQADATAVTPRKKKAAKKAAKKRAAAAPDTDFDPCVPGTTTRLCTAVRDQRNSDHCIAFAVAAAMEAALCRRHKDTAGMPEISAEHVFNEGGRQVGSVLSIKDAVRDGVLDVGCFPPGATNPCANSLSHIFTCDLRAVQAFPGDRVKLMKQQLRDVGPLITLINVFSNFADYDKVEPYVPTGPFAGIHAVCILGFQVPNGAASGCWIAKNSMGSGWGDNGFFRIPWEEPLVKPEEVVFVAADVLP